MVQNVGVVQSGGGLRLTLEAGQCLRVPGYFIWKDQRGLLQERRRLRQVDAHRWLVGLSHRVHPHVGVARERMGELRVWSGEKTPGQTVKSGERSLKGANRGVIGLLHARNTDAVCNQRAPEGTKTT